MPQCIAEAGQPSRTQLVRISEQRKRWRGVILVVHLSRIQARLRETVAGSKVDLREEPTASPQNTGNHVFMSVG
jgi:hypothetical protein